MTRPTTILRILVIVLTLRSAFAVHAATLDPTAGSGRLKQIIPGHYVYSINRDGRLSNSDVVATSEGVLVFDALKSEAAARAEREAIASVMQQPIGCLVSSPFHDPMLSSSLLAHHGTAASYDSTKSLTLTGTLTKFSWTNPHSYVEFDVKGPDGQIVHWAAETNSPGILQTAGWSKNTLKAGDQVTLTVHPSKAGTPVGVVDRSKPVIVNGKVLSPASNSNDNQ
jgi:hypothetical protein